MSKPREGFKLPDFSGQTKTMFYNDGNPAALVVTNRRGRRIESTMVFPKAEAALDWCRQNESVLVYFPVRLEGN